MIILDLIFKVRNTKEVSSSLSSAQLSTSGHALWRIWCSLWLVMISRDRFAYACFAVIRSLSSFKSWTLF